MKYYFTIFYLFIYLFANSQSTLWTKINTSDIAFSRTQNAEALPTNFQAMELNEAALTQLLAKAPTEFTEQKGLSVTLPLPNGQLEEFEVWTSPIMEAGLVAKYPTIRTFKGVSKNNPLVISRFGISQRGFYAVLQSPAGSVVIDKLDGQTQNIYTTAFAKNYRSEMTNRTCGTNNSFSKKEMAFGKIKASHSRNRATEAVDLHLYKAAIACSGEYAQFHRATTKGDALAEIVSTLNRANVVFERDLALRLVLVDEVEDIIFLDPATDPYADGGDVTQSYQENPAAIERIIPVDQFDIGHVFIAGCSSGVVGIGGGKACDASKSLGISCQNGSDARFAIDIFAHEIGHQLYANHSWSSCPGNEEQLSSGTAYEPGSGSTIMSYAGACGGGNNIKNSSDDYFHVANIEEMLTEKLVGRTSSCPEVIATDNIKPIASTNYEQGFYIPISTPFELEGTGTDENGDPLTYCWEQYNRGPSSELGSPMRTAPIFRSFAPTTSPKRTFPNMQDVLNNFSNRREVLPTYSRNMTFRMTVRDNHPEAGGVDWTTVSFEATEEAGPFLVEFPNAPTDFLEVGDFAEIQWDVANTNGSLVNCQRVNILLSTDGGASFPITLVENTTNDGTQFVTIPNVPTSQARIRIEAADNIFFDLSNHNFDIRPSTQTGFSFAPAFQERAVCLPATVAIDLTTIGLSNFNNPISFSVNLADTLANIEGFSTDFITSTTIPDSDNQLLVELPADYPYASVPIEIVGTSDGASTVSRTVQLNLTANQFENFGLVSPNNGLSGVGLPTFNWTLTRDAISYEIEIATSPAFGESIVEKADQLLSDTYTPTTALPESTIYYWRVRPVNNCGAGEYSEIFAFQTENLSCTAFEAADIPQNISSLGTPTITSTIAVTQDFTISDLNIPKVRGTHDWVSHIRTSVISPAGTEAILFNRKCPGSVPFNIGFDDESVLEIPCPPINDALHLPQDALAIFDGESTFGDWQLQIEVIDNFGEGGALDEWAIEFCGNITLNPPRLVTNEPLSVQPKSGRLIDDTFLQTIDDNNEAADLTYTLVELPTIGTLLFDKQPMEVGEQLTQADLDGGLFKYRHDTDAVEGMDQFTFTVTDGEGGWIGITPFIINIDPSETTVSTEEKRFEGQIDIFPNPANRQITVRYSELNSTPEVIQLFDVHGRLLWQQNQLNRNETTFITEQFEAGLYFLAIHSEGKVYNRKVLIQ
ncbi:MAG: reprolysin-like metallopeptidase [Bacteroidota bacterium]